MRILPAGPRDPLWKRAVRWARQLLKPPRTPIEFMEAVVVAEREHRYAAAAWLCERGLRLFPGDYYLLMKRLAQVREKGDRATAEALLGRAVVCCPATAATFSSIAEEFAYLRKMEEAEIYFRRALERTPTNPLLREKLAMALVHEGKMEEGLQELSAALEAEPTNNQRRELLVQSLLHAGRFHDVVSLLNDAPQDTLSWESLMGLSIARARLEGGDAFADAVLSSTSLDPPEAGPS